MVGKTYLRYVAGPESGVVCSAAALSMDVATLTPNGAPIIAVPALEHVALWNSRTSTMVAKLHPPGVKPSKTNEVTSVQLTRDPLTSRGWLLCAGYASGFVSVWRGRGEDSWTHEVYGLSHRPDSIVLSLDVSPDGMSLASGGGDTDVTVWDLAAQEPQYRLVGHRGGVVGVTFVSGARTPTLVSGAADGLVKVWNLEVQQCVQTIIASDTQVTALRADMAGARLYVGLRDDVVKVYSMEGLRSETMSLEALNNDAPALSDHGVLQRKVSKPVTSVVFSTDKVYMAVVTNRSVEIFKVLSAADVKKKVQRKKKRRRQPQQQTPADAGDGAAKATRAEGGAEQGAEDSARDAATAAAAGGDAAEFKRTAAEEVIPQRVFHFTEKIRGLAFVPTKGSAGKVLRFAVATAHNVIDIYDCAINSADSDDDEDEDAKAAQQRTPLGELRHRLAINHLSHESDIRHLAFSSNNMAMATMSADCIKAWGTRNKAALIDDFGDEAFEEERRGGTAPALPPPEKLLSCTGTLGNLADGAELTGGFVLLPGDHTAVVGTSTGALLIVSLQRSEVIERIEAHPPMAVTGLTTMANGTSVVSIGKDRRLLKWDVTLVDPPATAAAGADGAAPSGGSTAKVVSLMLSEEIELTDTPLVVRATPNDKHLGVAMQDNNVQLLFADTLRPFLTLYGHKLPVTSIAFSADSTLCATVGMDKSLRFWGLDFGDCHKAIHAHDDYVTDVKFSAESHYVFTASMDGSVKHWDGDTWTLVQTVRMHQRGVWGLAVNGDGSFIAAAGVDKCIRTLMRTDQIIYPDEEMEREAQEAMDEQAVRDAARQKLDDLGGGDVAAGGHKTIATAEAGESLMEALDVVSVEVQRLNDGAAGQPHHALRGQTMWHFLWGTIMSIRPSELRHALSSLTSLHVGSLLQALRECIVAGVVTNYEVAGRVLLGLVKPAPGSNVPVSLVIGDDVNVLRLLDELQALVAAGLKAERDRLGRNTAGLAFVQQSMARHEKVIFHDRSKVQGAKRKFHSTQLPADGSSSKPQQSAQSTRGRQHGRGR